MATFRIYQNGSYANPQHLDPARHAWHLDGCGASRLTHPAPTLPHLDRRCGRASKPGVARCRPCAGSPRPARACASQRPPGRPIQRALDRPAAQRGGGAPADDRPSSYVGPPHTPAPLSPIGWTIMGGQNRVDTDGQGAGWTKWSGWHHRRVRRLIGFSTTWVGCGRRIGSGRAVGVRGGTLRGPGGWRSRRLAGGTSGWRGMCRFLRLGIVAPPKKMILLRLRRFGMRSGGVGRGRTRGGRLTGSRRVGGAPGPRSRASSSCRTRARATWRCGWRSGTRSGRGCRGRCEDVANADTDDEQIDRGQPEWGFRWSAPLPAAAMADQLSRRNWIAQ